ncbi:hypothetical protein CL652_00040 [bacterium]|nr:hypothetical protein [bacterium]|tara:strand:- start:2349 stop:2732 length:384 start_codon:yes stop_codon:yes gene_type:complete
MYGSTAERILRAGLAFSFLYPPVSAWFNPFAWIGYFPSFVLDLVGRYDMFVLHTFGATEILIGLWILFGKKVFWPSTLAAAYILGIVIFNLSEMDVVFRDISILAIAVVLALKSREEVTIHGGPQKS